MSNREVREMEIILHKLKQDAERAGVSLALVAQECSADVSLFKEIGGPLNFAILEKASRVPLVDYVKIRHNLDKRNTFYFGFYLKNFFRSLVRFRNNFTARFKTEC